MTKNSPEKSTESLDRPCVLICQHTSCLAAGSAKVLEAFGQVEGYEIMGSECLGQCSTGPTVRVIPEEIWYYRVQLEDVPLIINQHLKGGEPVAAKLNPRIHLRFDILTDLKQR